MKVPYIVQVVKRNHTGPFEMRYQKRSWGWQWVVVKSSHPSTSYVASVGFKGNSKQRRQQRRALLRELNK